MFVSESENYELQFQKSYLQFSSPLIGGNRCSLQFALRASFWSASFFISLMEGWIKLHKKFLKWEWSDDPNMVCLFIHLLIRANYEPSKWRGETIERGQLLTGRKQLSKWTGISERSIRTCLERLKTTSELTIKPTNKFSIITICNYEKYQQIPTSTSTIQTPTTDQQPTTSNNTKNTKTGLKGELSNSPKKSKYQRFIDFFNEVKGAETGTKGKFKGDAKSKRQFTAILKDYSGDDIASAVQSMFRDKHHKESGYKWATPELITRPDKFARFLGA